ncbi:type II secretion system protein [Anaerosphaera multitolerans]|uniref:Type II secretion system protein n=1 Tax=Anaerosphaera multitolerans TaxID=2487351 RepID=A0A437S7D7_9FIRM|nr:type II secretion system protein [Anaerosphaera multitolerans]RVU54963.1 type II secretion system protein [Anaerosphaera multitolerans]
MKKGFTLIEIIFTVMLLSILASYLLPSINGVLQNQNNLKVKQEMYLEARNQMENITSEIYSGNLYIDSYVQEKFYSKVESKEIGENLREITLHIKEKDGKGEVILKKILSTEGFYVN